MKTLLFTLATLGFVATLPAVANTVKTVVVPTSTVYAQEDCKDNEKWNEETQKCEEQSG